MRFKEFLTESDVTSLTRKAFKKTVAVANDSINSFLKEHWRADSFEGDNFQAYLDRLKPGFLRLASQIVTKLEPEYEKLATEEVEARFGKISKFKDIKSDHSGENWDKLWWVGTIKVWIDDMEGLGTQSSGYFQSSSREVHRAFPKRKLEGHDMFNDPLTGIQIALDVEAFAKFLKITVVDRVASNGEPYFDISHNKSDLEQLTNAVDTFSHEVTHLLQHTKSSLMTHKRNVANFDVYTKKNYLDPKTRKQIDNILDGDSKNWTAAQWHMYLSRAIEIDAHAVSVAAKVITACDDKNLNTELYNLETFLYELRAGYLESKSFQFYADVIKPMVEKDRRYASVWKRFLKKIATQVLTRIEDVKKEIKASESDN